MKDGIRSFVTPDDLTDNERNFLESFRDDVIQANNMEERTRGQADCEEWMTERKWRFTAYNFGKSFTKAEKP